MLDAVNPVEIALSFIFVSLAMRTTSSQSILRLAMLWLFLVVIAHGILVVERALPSGWMWWFAEVAPAILLWAISMLRREPQRFVAYPWARAGNSRGSNVGGNP